MGTRGRSGFDIPTIFFITSTLKGRERLFSTREIRDEVVSMLFRVTKNTETQLMAYCLMPSHVHMMAGHNLGGPGISCYMQSFKSLVSHVLFKERHGIWMPRFDDVIIASEDVFLTKLNYIHENPVLAGLVMSAIHWPWSSARFWYLDEPSDALTRTTDWMDLSNGARRGRLASTSGHIAQTSERKPSSLGAPLLS
jgi:putative transposase